MKRKFDQTLTIILLLTVASSCSSIQRRENMAMPTQPIVMQPNSGYIFFSYFTIAEIWPGKCIIRKADGGPKIGLTFMNSKDISYGLYEVEPGDYNVIGFSSGNDPLGDSLGVPVTAKSDQKWNICPGCVLYAGRVQLDFSKSGFSERTRYGIADASVEDLKKIGEYLIINKKTKIINSAAR